MVSESKASGLVVCYDRSRHVQHQYGILSLHVEWATLVKLTLVNMCWQK